MSVRPVAIRGPLPLLGLLLALAACGDDGGGGPPSGAGTVAYIVTSCRQTGTDMTLQQEVRILRGDAEAVTVMSVGPLGPFPSLACAAYGSSRAKLHPQYGPLQRFGITPDGSGIVFELTDEFVSDGRGLLPPEQRGIYYMRADGSGRRRLGAASRSPGFFVQWNELAFAFDPSGQAFTYVDRGPDEANHDAAQVFVQGLTPGERSRQVTRLPAFDVPEQYPENAWPYFIDARTIIFSRWTQPGVEFEVRTVNVDGTHLHELPLVPLPGGQVIPVFQVVGGDWGAGTARLPGEPVNRPPYGDWHINEVFVGDGTNLLQLTNFRRVDTSQFAPFYSARDQRVYFTASADPFGSNPSENCQIFSIDPIDRDLRQLTFFRESAPHARNGCFSGLRPDGCRIDFTFALSKPSQNPQGTIFFKSSCNPLGQNPNGWQVFAIQPDGSGLRQLTKARGAVRAADGTVEVENVDAFFNAPYE
jgi:hypothetical protein